MNRKQLEAKTAKPKRRYRGLTVGELRAALDGIADDVPVVTPGSDHSYNSRTAAAQVDAEASQDGTYLGEYYGPDHASPGSTIQKVLVIS